MTKLDVKEISTTATAVSSVTTTAAALLSVGPVVCLGLAVLRALFLILTTSPEGKIYSPEFTY